MSDLPRTARLYILLLTALALGAVFYCVTWLKYDLQLWVGVAIIAVGIAVLDALPIVLVGGDIEVTVSDTLKFAGVLLYPAPVAIVGVWLGTLFAEGTNKRAWFKKAFNISEMTLTWAMVACVYQGLRQSQVDYFGSLQNLLAIALAGWTAFAVNSILLSLVISLATQLPLRSVWWRNIRQVIWQDLSMLSLGIFLAVLWRYNPLTVLLAGLPLVVVRNSYQIANHLQQQTRDALVALMQVIDERDQHTFDHSERVSNYARSMAQALDLHPEEIEIIASAGLLHDLGKVGMADGILFNPNRLNTEERKSAERHAEIGAMLLSRFPLFQDGADLVRHHHERYDGKGYPDGLKGEEIPLGSRILGVADAYQAMTEERPYRHALTQEAAIAQLMEGSGTQFDPKLVEIFIGILTAPTPAEQPAPSILPVPAET